MASMLAVPALAATIGDATAETAALSIIGAVEAYGHFTQDGLREYTDLVQTRTYSHLNNFGTRGTATATGIFIEDILKEIMTLKPGATSITVTARDGVSADFELSDAPMGIYSTDIEGNKIMLYFDDAEMRLAIGQSNPEHINRAQWLRDVVSITVNAPASPPANAPSSWAVTEVSAAIDAGLVPPSIADAGWQNPTSRLAAADAIVLIIEKASGKTMAQIADENGWDLSTDHFADTNSPAVTFLKHAGITTGTGNNMYSPDRNYNRAEFVTMIGRAAENIFGITARGENPFTDAVPSWAAPYVGYAADTGITQGVSPGHFGSFQNLQNQQTAVFSLRTFNVWR
jgi:hypothetical protein